MAEYVCRCRLTPVPPDGCCPLPVWVVTTGGDSDGYEVAAVFNEYLDAHRYAAWWNSEETRRYGHPATRATATATATATAEEVDFYPTGTWRPPTHLHLAETNAASSDTSSPTPPEPAIGAPTDDPPCANGVLAASSQPSWQVSASRRGRGGCPCPPASL